MHSQSKTHEPDHLTGRTLHMITLTLGLDRSAEAIRTDGDLGVTLHCVTAGDPTSWSSVLCWVEYVHNSLSTSATGVTPFMAAYICIYMASIWLPTVSSLCSEPLYGGLEGYSRCYYPMLSGKVNGWQTFTASLLHERNRGLLGGTWQIVLIMNN